VVNHQKGHNGIQLGAVHAPGTHSFAPTQQLYVFFVTGAGARRGKLCEHRGPENNQHNNNCRDGADFTAVQLIVRRFGHCTGQVLHIILPRIIIRGLPRLVWWAGLDQMSGERVSFVLLIVVPILHSTARAFPLISNTLPNIF
jgi:hypothetical protein